MKLSSLLTHQLRRLILQDTLTVRVGHIVRLGQSPLFTVRVTYNIALNLCIFYFIVFKLVLYFIIVFGGITALFV